MSVGYRACWAVTFTLGALGLLLVPLVSLPLFPLAAAALYVGSHRLHLRGSGWAIVLPPMLLVLYPIVHWVCPEPFLDNWNLFEPEAAPAHLLHLLTPLELLSYLDPYWAGMALPTLVLGAPFYVGIAALLAVRSCARTPEP